ncbi:MAG: 2,3-bisphosphoglycerate-independent phosphoglycerate mutase [Candidatus Moranbacteria bacterium]|nr:2,3-bisphosphoglycerate-independent phosphoglycerate mutase [Candidatus Moranbacteria bacterium]
MYKPVVLVVLDGWGISSNTQGNTIRKAQLPTIEKLNKFYPSMTLQASGISVGLPWGESGNSEVGHMALGAGKIIYQNLPRITLSIQDGTFFKNEVLLTAMRSAKEQGSSFHLMGLIGDGSVHSHREHLYALLEMAKAQNLEKVFIHIFTDGRDSPPNAATKTIKELQDKIRLYGIGKIATLCGRNWALDRNNNWDRIEKAYRLLTEGKGELVSDPFKHLQDSYAKEITDEYVEPAVITENGKPVALVEDNDSLVFFNFRGDRSRELTKVFVLPGFEKFKREKMLKLEFVTMTEYEKDLPVGVAFPPEQIRNGLGEVLSKHKVRQLRLAETEKYAHVTYFFNGGKEEPWPGEDRILVPSPIVSKFDETPEMSAPQVTEKAIAFIDSGKYGFILINYANPDMVGHTGNEEACVEAVQAVDKSLSLLIPSVLKTGGCLLVTSDHGNVEEIRNFQTGQVDTEHSSNPVPLWFITSDNHRQKRAEEIVRGQTEVGGLLSDITPTILDIMKIEKPKEMNGESLLPILK